ncbi:phage tail tape measure protein [Tenacibaculum agarivorans]|uniref:hypothetical protein n=1 Tax=Tenacibaculum agarivorans TaxID=1908389 RepID=UPI00094B9C55|nr:hypothetical protein [Tenacibaculum agarivorans]
MTDKQLQEIKKSISKVSLGISGVNGAIDTTNEKLDIVKFSIDKLANITLRGIAAEIQTGNKHLEKSYQSIDKGFKSIITAITKPSAKSPAKKDTVGLTVSKGIGLKVIKNDKPESKVTPIRKENAGLIRSIPQQKGSPLSVVSKNSSTTVRTISGALKPGELKLTPLLKPLNVLEKTIHKISGVAKKGFDEVQKYHKHWEKDLAKFSEGDKPPNKAERTINKQLGALFGNVALTYDKTIGKVLSTNYKALFGKIGKTFGSENRKKLSEKIKSRGAKLNEKRKKVGAAAISATTKTVKFAVKAVGVVTGASLLSVSWWRKRLGAVKKFSLKSIKGLKKKIENMTINPKKMVAGLKKGFDNISKSFAKGVEGMTNVKSGLEGMNSLMKSAGIESEGMSKAIKGVTLVLTILSTAQAIAAAGKWAMSLAQWNLNAAIAANPVGAIVLGIIGLITVIAIAWDKFEGFRTTVMGMWEVLKSFGSVIKDFVINRIKGILSGITGLGSALVKLFSGDFSGAWKTAKQAVKDFVGVDDYVKAGKGLANAATNIKENFKEGQRKGVNAKIGPELKKILSGGKVLPPKPTGTNGGKTGGGNLPATGKTIQINTPLVEEINVYNQNKGTLKETSATIKQEIIKVLKIALQDTTQTA